MKIARHASHKSPVTPLLALAGLAAAVSVTAYALTSTAAQDPVPSSPTMKTAGSIKVAKVDHSDWDRILRTHVRNGRVDYLMIRKHDFDALTAYLDYLAAVDTTALPRDEQLAMYCNLYNASMFHAIVSRYADGYSCAEGDKRIFREPLVRVNGRCVALNHLEHEMIRAGFGDPRIHAALVCGGLGCPLLPAKAFTGPALSQELDAAMTGWATDASRNPVDPAAGTVQLSSLFKSYADDFGGVDKAIAAVDKYHPADFTKLKVSFLPTYDWTLNAAPPSAGRWITAPANTPAWTSPEASKSAPQLLAREIYEVTAEQGDYLRLDRPFGIPPCWVKKDTVTPYAPKLSATATP